MSKLDHTFSSLSEIDHQALHMVTGGVSPKTPSADGGTGPKPPGKIKKGILLGGTLIGILTGHVRGPVQPPGAILREPQPPIAGAPPNQPPNPPLLFNIE